MACVKSRNKTSGSIRRLTPAPPFGRVEHPFNAPLSNYKRVTAKEDPEKWRKHPIVVINNATPDRRRRCLRNVVHLKRATRVVRKQRDNEGGLSVIDWS